MGSFIEAHLCVQEFGKENVLLLFADTKMEDEDLYRFLKDSQKFLGCELVTLCDGRTPWGVFRDVRFMGNNRIDPCSLHLKRNLLDNYIRRYALQRIVNVHVGIDYTEKHRLQRIKARMETGNMPITYRSLMIERRFFLTQAEKKAYPKRLGINPPRLYYYGFEHNNCGGFCVKSGLGQFKKLWEQFPARYDFHVEQERILRAEVPTAKPFLRKVVQGKLYYIWLEDFRTFLEGGGELEDEELGHFGGCGCAID
jgi:hypothetical protein